MKKIVFTEEFCQPQNLFPFTLTRQIQDIRVGILTIREKWERMLGLPSFDRFEDDYKDLDRAIVLEASMADEPLILVHGNVLPTPELVKGIKKLKPGECITLPEKESVVFCISRHEIDHPNKIRIHRAIETGEQLRELHYPWDIFRLNDWAIRQDFALLTKGRKSAKPSASNQITGKDLFLEKGVAMEHCILNSTEGPIYIGRNATVMEGSCLRGPLAIGEGATVKMGTRIYGATTVGPFSTVGGEIKNAVLFGYSNKAHDGYLGDSVIGEWCNFGAGTSTSNVKNTASDVVVWTPGGPRNVGLKCGTLMGDYARTAINTALNTGTVIGVCANVFGSGLSPKYIPSFSWGAEGMERYRFDKALKDIAAWKALKKRALTEQELIILRHIFDHY